MLTTDHTRSPSAPEEEPGLVPNREPLAVGFLGSLQGSGVCGDVGGIWPGIPAWGQEMGWPLVPGFRACPQLHVGCTFRVPLPGQETPLRYSARLVLDRKSVV